MREIKRGLQPKMRELSREFQVLVQVRLHATTRQENMQRYTCSFHSCTSELIFSQTFQPQLFSGSASSSLWN